MYTEMGRIADTKFETGAGWDRAAFLTNLQKDAPSFNLYARSLIGPQIAASNAEHQKTVEKYRTKIISKQEREDPGLKKDGWSWNEALGRQVPVPANMQKRFQKGLGFKGDALQSVAQKTMKSRELLKLQTPEDVVEAFVPEMIKQLVRADTSLGLASFGPINNKSLPFYVGRYVDPRKGTMKAISAPSTKLVNPTNNG